MPQPLHDHEGDVAGDIIEMLSHIRTTIDVIERCVVEQHYQLAAPLIALVGRSISMVGVAMHTMALSTAVVPRPEEPV